MPLFRRLLALLLAALLCSVAVAQTPTPAASVSPNALRQQLTAIPTQPAEDGDISESLAAMDAIRTQAELLVADRKSQLAELDNRLAQLGTAPEKGTGTEVVDIVQQRAALQKQRDALDNDLKLARLVAIDAQQFAKDLVTQRRARFTERLTERTDSPLSVDFWRNLAASWPSDLRRLAALADSVHTQFNAAATVRTTAGLWAKLAAVLLFSVLWFTFGYLPLAHMVWASGGYLFEMGALDFAGGTVVHINAGIAGLVGAYFIGKRIGYGREALKPHNVTFTYIGAMLLWVGWFGFNAGSNLEATGGAALAFINTMLATAAAILAWSLTEKVTKGKSSALGVASGAVAGLVGITPAAGLVGPFGAIAIGAIAGVLCVWGVSGLKRLLGADDTADVFGVHGIGGIVGAILTGVFTDASFGGIGLAEGVSIGQQVGVQALGVGITIVWIGIVSAASFFVAKLVFGLRVSEDAEREGLDITSHGETAYEA